MSFVLVQKYEHVWVMYSIYWMETITLKKICCMNGGKLYRRVRSCLWWKLNSAIMLENFVALHMSENTRPTHGNSIGAERTRSTKTEKYHWRTKSGRQMRLHSSVKYKCGYCIPRIWSADSKQRNRGSALTIGTQYHHLSRENRDNLLWMNIDMPTRS